MCTATSYTSLKAHGSWHYYIHTGRHDSQGLPLRIRNHLIKQYEFSISYCYSVFLLQLSLLPPLFPSSLSPFLLIL